jgi:hypothetical protein
MFKLAAAVSLVLCVATAVQWARSYRVSESVRCDNGTRGYEVRTGQGSISFSTVVRYYVPRTSGTKWWFHRQSPVYPSLIADQRVWHIRYQSDTFHFSGIILSYALIAAPLSILPVAWLLVGRRLWRRTAAGSCHGCGYDLCATPDRCPECGIETETADPAGGRTNKRVKDEQKGHV